MSEATGGAPTPPTNTAAPAATPATPAAPAPAPAAPAASETDALKAIVEAQKATLAELAGKVKSLTEAGMTAEQKQAARLAELEGAAEKAQRFDAMIAKRRDEALGKLPAAVQERLKGVLTGLDGEKALELIEAAGLVQTTAPTVAPHERGAPTTQGVLPTLDQINANPDLIMNLKPEERAAILSQIGIQTGGGTLFGN